LLCLAAENEVSPARDRRRLQNTMELNKLIFGGLALGCLTAAAGGGYLAARHSTVPVAEMAAVPTPAAAKPVAESEGVIAPEPATPAPSPASVAVETPVRESRPQPAVRRGVEQPAPRRASTQTVSAAPAARTTRTEAPTRTPASSAPASSSTASGGSMWEVRPPVEPERAPANVEPEPPAAPAAPETVELVVPADAVLGLQVERTVTSETARVEDRVEARVTRDVRVGDRVAIPAGSVVQGSVMEVERGGKVRERARLGIRFHTVVLADGSRLNIRTDSVVREGTSPTNESAAKIGGAAVGGAILGAILGGGKGAVIGGTVGAAGGTAATMAGGRNPAVLPAGTTVSVRVQQPVNVTVEKE
jgi:hypothetical protein